MTITDSTFANNGGGGINYAMLYDLAPAMLAVSNTTISSNSGPGLFAVAGDALLTNVTIRNNNADVGAAAGGIVAHNTGSLPPSNVTLNNSLVAGNMVNGTDKDLAEDGGTLDTSSSHNNLIGDSVSAIHVGFAEDAQGNLVGRTNTQIALSELDYFGGPTRTHSLLPDSHAIGEGSNSFGGESDQRGFARQSTRDIGAFEYVDHSSASIYVTTLADSGIQRGKLSLRQALNLADLFPVTNTIRFDDLALIGSDGIITLDHDSPTDGDDIADELTIGSSVNIIGPGTLQLTIDANARSTDPRRVFKTTTGTVTISDLSIAGGYANGATAVDQYGGGIFNDGADLTLSRVAVVDNQSTSVGGGIYSSGGSLTLENTAVLGNVSLTDGGGVYVTSPTFTVRSGSRISDNKALNGPGGLYVNGVDDFKLLDSEVSRNQGTLGGGLRIQTDNDSNTLLIQHSVLADNIASQQGGGIYLTRADGTDSKQLKIEQSQIRDNEAAVEGGGVHITNATLNVVESEIERNSSPEGGGGYVKLSSDDSLAITNSSIANNAAESPSVGTAGGGFYVNGPGTAADSVQISGTTFASNYSRDLDASTTVGDNTAGGLYLKGVADASIDNSTFSGNQSDEWGGALSFEASGPATITNSTIAHNESRWKTAGGIWVQSGSSAVLLHNTILAENRALLDDPADLNKRNLVGSINTNSSYNLIGPTEPLSLMGVDNQLLDAGQTAGLTALAEYGGTALPSGKYVETHGLQDDSPAVDHSPSDQSWSQAQDQRAMERYNVPPGGDHDIDIGAFELQQRETSGDFNGDGHLDYVKLERNPTSPEARNLDVHLGGHNTAGSAVWAELLFAGYENFQAGDFNGDGRDDLAFQDPSDAWIMAFSDGSQFSVVPLLTLTGIPRITDWAVTTLGDFDGDGLDELIGRNAISGLWEVLHYENSPKSFLASPLTNYFNNESDWTIFVGDVNRDGHDDLVGRRRDVTGGRVRTGLFPFRMARPFPP